MFGLSGNQVFTSTSAAAKPTVLGEVDGWLVFYTDFGDDWWKFFMNIPMASANSATSPLFTRNIVKSTDLCWRIVWCKTYFLHTLQWWNDAWWAANQIIAIILEFLVSRAATWIEPDWAMACTTDTSHMMTHSQWDVGMKCPSNRNVMIDLPRSVYTSEHHSILNYTGWFAIHKEIWESEENTSWAGFTIFSPSHVSKTTSFSTDIPRKISSAKSPPSPACPGSAQLTQEGESERSSRASLCCCPYVLKIQTHTNSTASTNKSLCCTGIIP